MMTVQFIAPTKRKKISKREAARLFLLHNGICCNCGQQIKDGEKWFIELRVRSAAAAGRALGRGLTESRRCASRPIQWRT